MDNIIQRSSCAQVLDKSSAKNKQRKQFLIIIKIEIMERLINRQMLKIHRGLDITSSGVCFCWCLVARGCWLVLGVGVGD